MLDDEMTKLVWRTIIALIGPVVGYLFWDRKKQHREMEEIKKRLSDNEKQIAVIMNMVANISEDIREIKYMFASRRREYRKDEE